MPLFGVEELGLDLGSSGMRIVLRDKGVVLNEPAYIAYERLSRTPIAFGEEARRMYGRAPRAIIVERPFRQGWMHSFDLLSAMLRSMLHRVAKGRPRVMLAMPGGLTPTDRQTLVDVIIDAGAREVSLVDEAAAAAIGTGLDIAQQYGRMLVDIGGARTNVAVYAQGRQVLWDILENAGDRFDDAIVDYMRRRHNLLIGERTAEQLKTDIGGARIGIQLSADAYGRSLVTGLPRAITISSDELNDALSDALRDLMLALHRTLERTPPELANDIFETGIALTGGGALLSGLDKMITEQLGIRAIAADEPELATAHGLMTLLSDRKPYENVDLYHDRKWNRID
ncbi:MAG: rod shape-determining protein [Clostridiales bacterium]|nr:rod shape-determining protein [Clostridiales bacterium]